MEYKIILSGSNFDGWVAYIENRFADFRGTGKTKEEALNSLVMVLKQ